MNLVFDFKTIAGISLIVCSAWLLFSLPARIRHERHKLTALRQTLAEEVTRAVNAQSRATPMRDNRLIVIYKLETVEYVGKTISAINWRVICRNDENQFWLKTFYSDDRPPLDELISELRARRALFLHPREYQIAFGAYPHREQLLPLLENSAQNKLQRFNPEVHPGEMFVTKAIGQEFSARN